MTDRRTIHRIRLAFGGTNVSVTYQDDALGLQVFEAVAASGRVRALGFSGMRCNPDYHLVFPTAEEANAHRDLWIAERQSSAAAKTARAVIRRARFAHQD